MYVLSTFYLCIYSCIYLSICLPVYHHIYSYIYIFIITICLPVCLSVFYLPSLLAHSLSTYTLFFLSFPFSFGSLENSE